MIRNKLSVSLAAPPIDLSRIVSCPVEAIADIQTIDRILEQIKQYKQQLDSDSEVGVALIQNTGRAGSYWIVAYDEARPGTKIGDWSWYIKFWSKSYFSNLKQKLLQGENT